MSKHGAPESHYPCLGDSGSFQRVRRTQDLPEAFALHVLMCKDDAYRAPDGTPTLFARHFDERARGTDDLLHDGKQCTTAVAAEKIGARPEKIGARPVVSRFFTGRWEPAGLAAIWTPLSRFWSRFCGAASKHRKRKEKLR